MFTLINWNIQHGGGRRVEAIDRALGEHDPAIAVLTEFRPTNEALQGRLDKRFPFNVPSVTQPHQNGLCLYSRYPIQVHENGLDRRRVVVADIATLDLTLIAAYFPLASHGRAAKHKFWADCLNFLSGTTRPALFLGDFNTGANGMDQQGESFSCSKEFVSLPSAGWTDLWRHYHGEKLEYSWFSRKGNGYRVDHAFANSAMIARIHSCRYEHAIRTRSTSDHSMMIVEFSAHVCAPSAS